MTWTRLSDDFNDRPDMLRLSRSARLLHVEAMVYANRVLTDGLIPTSALSRFSDSVNLETEVHELVEVGCWQPADAGRAWQIVGWADQDGEQQELRADVQARKAGSAERSRRRRQHQAGDHSGCDSKYCRSVTRDEQRDDHRDATRAVTARVTPSRPGPSRPGPEGQGRDRADSRCEHGQPIAADGTRCAECVGAPLLALAPPAGGV